MKIYNPQNEYGQELVNTGAITNTFVKLTKTITSETLLLTDEDVENISEYQVKQAFCIIDDEKEQVFTASEDTDDGLLITFCEEGNFSKLGFTDVYIVLERKNQNVLKMQYGEYYSTGIFVNTEIMMEHFSNSDIHMDGDMKNMINTLFKKYVSDQKNTTPPAVAPSAMSDADVWKHFQKYAMPGYSAAPSRYYTRWVPNALNGNLTSTFKGTSTESTMGYIPSLTEVPSTHTTTGQNNWWGKEWLGYWEYCNFIEAYGCKFPTAILGDVNFSWDNNIGVIMPALFFNICEEKIDGATTDRYGYTIADSPFDELLQADREDLIAHGITTLYRHPAATYYDPNKYGTLLGGYVNRPYMVMAAFAGGYEDGKMVSKLNKPQWNNMNYNNYLSSVSNMGTGDGMRDGLVHMWEVVKYGTKHSQSIFSGLISYSPSANSIQYTLPEAGYIVPVASTSNFNPMCSVYLTTTSTGADDYPYTMTNIRKEARVLSIEQRTLTVSTSDGGTKTVENVNCLVLDPDTIDAFYCCATQAEAETLQNEGKIAFAYVRGSAAPLTGETYYVLNHDDGACYNLTNNRHPYRVQGMEVLPGILRLKANTVLQTGMTSVDRPVITENTVYDGSTGKPIADSIEKYNSEDPSSSTLTTETLTCDSTSQQWCYCYLRHQARSNDTTTIKSYAYPTLAFDGTSSGYVMQVSIDRVSGAVLYTKMGTSSTQGHQDYRWYGAGTNEALSGCHWGSGSNGGSVSLRGYYGLGDAYSSFGAGL